MPDDSVNLEKTPLRYSVKGKRMKFFDAQGVDELVSICMGLAQEMWGDQRTPSRVGRFGR